MLENPSLTRLGWVTTYLVDPLPEGCRPARVVLHGRDAWRVHDGADEVVVGVRGRLRQEPAALPVAGDWVLLGAEPVIEQVLPRRTCLTRKAAGVRTEEQVLAANIDVVLVCVPVTAVNARRLERELTTVWESGAEPVVVVTKTDLADDLDEVMTAVSSVALGVQVLATSSYALDGVEQVRALVPEGRTGALLGPSGAGKSTLVNALVGSDVLATTPVRHGDLRGVHTTTARHLVALPDAGLLMDTPGLRELALWAEEDALDAAFPDVDELASSCRFSDCRHDSEPGCAVRAALACGELGEDRFEAWRTLQRELAFLARKKDVRLRAQERRRGAQISREGRARARP